MILPALVLFFKDPTLPFVDNPFLPAVVNISTVTRFFLVGDSDLVTDGKGGITSVLPGVKDEDRGLLCRGVDVDVGLGVAGAIDLGLELNLVSDVDVLVVDLRHGDLGEGWTGVGRGGSTFILSSSVFCFFVVLALCLFAGRGLVEDSSSSSRSDLGLTLLFVDVTDILCEWDDTTLARSSFSLSSSSIVRLLRLRDARDEESRRGAGGS